MSRAHNFTDLTGRRFGRVTVLEYAGKSSNRGSRWKCRCICGAEFVANASDLRSGRTRSCGCLRIEVNKTTIQKAYRKISIPCVIRAPDGIRHSFASATEAAAWLRCAPGTVLAHRASGKAFRGNIIESQ